MKSLRSLFQTKTSSCSPVRILSMMVEQADPLAVGGQMLDESASDTVASRAENAADLID